MQDVPFFDLPNRTLRNSVGLGTIRGRGIVALAHIIASLFKLCVAFSVDGGSSVVHDALKTFLRYRELIWIEMRILEAIEFFCQKRSGLLIPCGETFRRQQ